MWGCWRAATCDLAQETLAADDGGQLGVEDLDGDLALVAEVLGEIHRGHAALAELPLDPVAVAIAAEPLELCNHVVPRGRPPPQSSLQFMTMMSWRSCSTGRTMTKLFPSGTTS